MKKRLLILLALLAVGTCSLASPSENYLRSRVVKLSSSIGMCSGEQIHAPNGKDYILTAAHCREVEDASGNFLVTEANGATIMRKAIAEDPNSDLLLVEGIPNMRGLDIAKSDHPQQHVRTFTHGGNMPTWRSEGEIIGDIAVDVPIDEALDQKCAAPKDKMAIVPGFLGVENVCCLHVTETASTAKTVPGSSGGMMVNDKGQVVGVCSAGDSDFSFFVSLQDIHKFLHDYAV